MNRIGTLNEYDLHDQIKNLYLTPRSSSETKVDNFIVDIVKKNLLIEIQTKSFSSIKHKLNKLLKDSNVKLVYPLTIKKIIRVYDKKQKEILYERKSPKRGQLVDLVHELIYIPQAINHKNFSLEVLMINELESRCDDGKGSWRRKGISLINRSLIEVLETKTFRKPKDYSILLPPNLPPIFTNRYLIKETDLTHSQTYKLTNILKKINVIKVKKMKGRAQVFEINH